MKELSIEDKATRYDEAIKHLKSMIPSWERLSYNGKTFLQDLFYILPELKENENERIRKELIDFVKSRLAGFPDCKRFTNWLEKQGEQSDANKEYWRGYNEGKQCILDKYDEIEKQGEQKPADKVEPKFKVGQTIKKEGFNLGFPIVKIEDGFYYNDMGDHFPFTDQDNWELVEQEPEWSEKDEKMFARFAACLGYHYHDGIMKRKEYEEAHNWLKSLKDRVQPQHKQEWSEEDKALIYNIEQDYKDKLNSNPPESLRPYYNKVISWLKSLHPQKQWRPSEEQIKGIECAIKTLQHQLNVGDKRLNSLYDDLKKLMEE